MKILGIGESVIDNVRIIQGHKNDLPSFIVSESQHLGGPVLSALILLSRLNIDCTLLTSLGRDNEAEIIRQKIEEENIKVITNLEEKTKINIILINVQNGHREKLRGAVKHAPIINISTEFIQQFDLIIMDRHERKAFYEIVSKKKPSAKIVIDPSTEVSDFTLDMMRYADYPIIPIESLVKIGKGKKLEICLKHIYEICQKPIIITAGELGSLIYDGKKLELIPAFQIKVVDTTGAGDIYRGAFVYGLIQGLSLSKCASFANGVAALQCTKLGNVSAIPHEKEVKLLTGLFNQRRILNLSTVNNYYLDLHQSI